MRLVDKSTFQSSRADLQNGWYLTLHWFTRVNSMVKKIIINERLTHSVLCPITTVWHEVGGSLQYLVHWIFFFFCLEICTSIYTWQAYISFLSQAWSDTTRNTNTQIPKHTSIRSERSSWQQQYLTEWLDPLALESKLQPDICCQRPHKD